jgi:hypothetical protein
VGDAERGMEWPAERVNLWTARLERSVAVGDVIELSPAAGHILLFDPRTGSAIER